ncbi:MAG TPA: sigma-70 family RNA polymerase sigma factor [Solirubrobacteraceae bacterium]
MSGLRGPSALLRLQSDERLIALTRKGHHAAFEVLCSRYQSRLLSFCRHMLSSKEDAEDVLQEVFAAAFNAVLADERAINVRPWLYRIARNRSLNHLRRNTATGMDSMDVHFAENGISTSDKVLRRESFRELIADVHQLPETQRTALLLREIDAMSYEQIAQAMETTVPSVKSLLVRARISLAEAAEARRMSCEEVRLELGEVAEGLLKLSQPARRHVRTCERCEGFKKHLRENNHVLAAVLPVAPLLMLKKLILAKLGLTASAGGAHVATGSAATVGAGASIGAAAGGSSLAGGLMTAGAGALATKAAAGLAAAALVTAGAVAADHAVVAPTHHRHHAALTASAAGSTAAASTEPVVSEIRAQPPSAGSAMAANRDARKARHAAAVKTPATVPATIAVPLPATPTAPTTEAPATPQTPEQVTEVTTETTQLPTSATSGEAPTTTTTSATTPAPVTTTETPASPVEVSAAPRTVQRHRERTPPASTGGVQAPTEATGSRTMRALIRAGRRNAAATSG